MRTLDVPEKADILISELLGSFGDNELSPECLDGAMRFLKGELCGVLLIFSHEALLIYMRVLSFHRGRNLDTIILHCVPHSDFVVEIVQRSWR